MMEYNIEMDVTEAGCGADKCMEVAYGRVYMQAYVET
jgi:hypothetical protein